MAIRITDPDRTWIHIVTLVRGVLAEVGTIPVLMMLILILKSKTNVPFGYIISLSYRPNFYSAKKLKLRRVLQILCGAFERCSRVRL